MCPVFVFVHEGAALITIGAFIIHLCMGLFRVPGSTDAMLHGYVTMHRGAGITASGMIA
jgi:cytochrome b subunit of formate dehydrogenase